MSHRETVIVTGSSGLIGSTLVSYLAEKGFNVRAFQRKISISTNPSIEYYPFDLMDIKDIGFDGADYLIHCAYRPIVNKHQRESSINIDIEGVNKLINFSRKYNFKIIFLSTLSAHKESKSYYAKNKLLAESLFDVQKDLILKLGIVLGEKGSLFGKIVSNLRKYKIVPLIGGNQRTQTIAVDDLCAVIESGINNNISGNFKISHPQAITTKELYHITADAIGIDPIFIPVPLGISYRLVQFLENFGFKLPFSAENILGIQDLRAYDTMSDLDKFGLKIKDCRETLAQLDLKR